MSVIADPTAIDSGRLQALQTLVGGSDWTCSVCLASAITQPESQSYTGVALRSIGATACPSGQGGSIHSHFFHEECAKYVYESMGNQCPICKAPDVLKPIFKPVFRDSQHGLPVPQFLEPGKISEMLRAGQLDLSQDERGKTPFHRAVDYKHLDFLMALTEHWKIGIELRDTKGASPLDYAAANGETGCIRVLIEGGCRVNGSGRDQKTALYHAATYRNLDGATALLESKVTRVDQPDAKGRTPLYAAASKGHLSMMSLLIAHRALVSRACSLKRTPLQAAIRNHHTDAAALLLATGKPGVNVRGEGGETALYIASSLGNTNIMLLLFAHGAVVDLADNEGKTPLHIAATNGHVDAARILLDHEAKVSHPDRSKCSALYWAAYQGHLAVATLLLDRGAQVNAADTNLNTPLHAAAHRNHTDLLTLLAARGAQLDPKASNRMSALHMAAHAGHVEATRVLLGLGIDKEAVDKAGETALHTAAKKGHLGVTTLLVGSQVATDPRDCNEMTPLYLAARAGHPEVMTVLLDAKAEIDLADKRERTPLFAAAQSGRRRATKRLLDLNARVDLSSESGNTPLLVAAGNGHHEVVALLLAGGADPTLSNENGDTALSRATSGRHQRCVDLLKPPSEERKREADGELPVGTPNKKQKEE